VSLQEAIRIAQPLHAMQQKVATLQKSIETLESTLQPLHGIKNIARRDP
jgi:hypothetical protein